MQKARRHTSGLLLMNMTNYRRRSLPAEKLLQEQSDHRKQIEAIWNPAEDRIKEVETDAGEKLRAIEKRLEEAEAEREKELNENLIRIMKERANAKRGIQPKKKDPGYRIAGKLSQAKASSSYDKKCSYEKRP